MPIDTAAYREVREGEAKLDTAGMPPPAALRRLVEFTFDHHHRHEDFIRMVMIENIHHGQYLARSASSTSPTAPPSRRSSAATSGRRRSEEHTSELQSLMRISYA